MAYETQAETNRRSDVTSLQSKDKNLHPDNQDYWYYCNHSYIVDDKDVNWNKEKNLNWDKEKNINWEKDKDTTWNKEKDTTWNKDTKHENYKYYSDKRHVTRMDSLLCNSFDMLKEYFDYKTYPNNQIPFDLFEQCRGIIFLRVWKGGIVLGGMGGTGIVLARRNGMWTNPCAISVGGIQLGLEFGIERVDDILLLRDDTALRLFIEKGNFKLGADASIAAGPFGRDTNSGIAMSGGQSKSVYVYSFAKGAYIGLSLDGAYLSVNDSVNEEFYGRKVIARDILEGDLVAPQNDCLCKLKQLLNNYCINRGNETVINDTTIPSNTTTTTTKPIIHGNIHPTPHQPIVDSSHKF